MIAATVAAAAVVTRTPGDDVLRGTADTDRISAFAGNDLVYARAGGDDIRASDDSLFGGRGADRVFGERGNDELHALAADGDIDLLQCGPGRDEAWVLRAERPRTQIVGYEAIYLVDVVSPDQEEGENAAADTEADE
jgi:Ca2+-binding RTX toxin-like protein